MSRSKLVNDLPLLKDLFPDPEIVRMKGTQSQTLANELYRIIPLLRHKGKSRIFFTVRDLAVYFSIDGRVVSRVYEKLQNEGLLMRVRGSCTRLTALEAVSQQPVNGVVCIPVWLHGFCKFTDWRLFHIKMEESLRKLNYIANFIFYGFEDDPESESFYERVLMHKPDYILWYQPLIHYHNLLQKLADRGVKPVVIHDTNLKWLFPFYLLDDSLARKSAFADWKKDQIQEVLILNSPKFGENLHEPYIHAIEQAGLIWKISNVMEIKKSPVKSYTGIVIPEKGLSYYLLNQFPDEVLFLIQNYRVLVPCRLDLHREVFSGMKMDVIHIDDDFLTRQLAHDIAASDLQAVNEPRVFYADYLPQASAGQFAQVI